MYTSQISADQTLRELALAISRNNLGAMRPVADIIRAEGLSQTEFAAISANPQYQKYVENYTNELRDNGFSIQAKAKLLLEDLLPTMYHLARDPDAPAPARVKVFENFAELADVKPKNNTLTPAGAGFSITINLPNTGPKTLVFDANTAEEARITPVLGVKTAQNTHIPDEARQIMPVFVESADYEYAGDDYVR